MPEINPKMQPRMKTAYRKWQHADDPTRDYAYGICPYCGVVGEAWGAEPSGEDGIQIEFWSCDACGCEWELQQAYAYRFHRIVPEDER